MRKIAHALVAVLVFCAILVALFVLRVPSCNQDSWVLSARIEIVGFDEEPVADGYEVVIQKLDVERVMKELRSREFHVSLAVELEEDQEFADEDVKKLSRKTAERLRLKKLTDGSEHLDILLDLGDSEKSVKATNILVYHYFELKMEEQYDATKVALDRFSRDLKALKNEYDDLERKRDNGGLSSIQEERLFNLDEEIKSLRKSLMGENDGLICGMPRSPILVVDLAEDRYPHLLKNIHVVSWIDKMHDQFLLHHP
jgi:hypothetical protein